MSQAVKWAKLDANNIDIHKSTIASFSDRETYNVPNEQ